jgi:uncharacterized protein
MWYERNVRRLWLVIGVVVVAAVGIVVFRVRSDRASLGCAGTTELGGMAFAERFVHLESGPGPSTVATTGCVFVADTTAKRAQGLSRVTDLEGKLGMVFVYDADSEGRYWMKNTPMPLSIAWFDAAGVFVSSADMDPCTAPDCPTYGAAGPYRYALEVPKGRLPALGVGPGARLELS